MTDQPRASYPVNCPVCGRCQDIGNPRPREVPSRVLVDPNWFVPPEGYRLGQDIWIKCPGCGGRFEVFFAYAPEEVLRELDLDLMPPL